MKKFATIILTILFLTLAAPAQSSENQPVLFDEFEKLSNDDASARLHNLAYELEKTKNSKALIRIYGGREERFAFPYLRGSLFRLFMAIGNLPAEKIIIQFCNVNNEPFLTRFFIVHENDRIETCAENLSVPKETVLFEKIHFFEPQFKLTPFESSGGWEGASQGEYSQFAQDVLKRLLSASPQSRVYLVGYLQTNFEMDFEGKIISRKTSLLDKKPLAAKMLQAAKDNLLKNGFSAAQIETIDGGYKERFRQVEIWFVPAGGAIPKPKPDFVPKKRK